MKQEPLVFTFPLDDFDLAKLPVDPEVLRSKPGMLKEAVSNYFSSQFKTIGGEAHITIRQNTVTLRWVPESGLAGLVEHGIALLQKGDYGTGMVLLQSALYQEPDNPSILFNLGMAYSDKGNLAEALALLSKLTSLEPDNPRAWTALGVALFRSEKLPEAEQALRRGVELDPEDGYAHRNLGGLLIGRDRAAGLRHMAKAADLLPDDQAAQFNYGSALLQDDKLAEADKILIRAIEIAPLSSVAEQARTARTQIAHQNMRSAVGGAPRMDAVMYCLSALKLFAESPDKLQPVTFEIAMLGRGGLDINNPVQQYTLKTMPGKFSGLHLVSYMYVGLKQLDPSADPGIDLSKEYEMAKQMQAGK